MSKKRIWFNGEAEYVGATGVNSVREMAELAHADGGISDALGMESDPTVDEIEATLNFLGVRSEKVGVSTLHMEIWDQSKVFRCSIDDKPGRGLVKVLGVNV